VCARHPAVAAERAELEQRRRQEAAKAAALADDTAQLCRDLERAHLCRLATGTDEVELLPGLALRVGSSSSSAEEEQEQESAAEINRKLLR
jgi:hypothetical protein